MRKAIFLDRDGVINKIFIKNSYDYLTELYIRKLQEGFEKVNLKTIPNYNEERSSSKSSS